MKDAAPAIAEARRHVGEGPFVGLILGSGLGGFADRLEGAVRIPYGDLPGVPPVGVAGHAGQLVGGRLGGRRCLVLEGRAHLYEGHDADTVALPARVLVQLGLSALIVTNAAGAAHARLRPGSLMRIEDHINLLWRNPLTGPVSEGETRFPDMSAPYSERLGRIADAAAAELGIRLDRGVYCAVHGPSYETPAEIRAFARLGADAVGMSTVPEVLVARAAGVPVLGISVITNAGAGLGTAPLSHEEVVETGRSVRADLARLLEAIVRAAPAAEP